MSIGTVKWFSNAKGYGFIAPAEGGEDIFAHFSSITQEVEFECTKGPKGKHAVEIKLSAMSEH